MSEASAAPVEDTGKPIRVAFLLPSTGGGGGANSVVQEATGLARFGCPVAILVNVDNRAAFARNYPELLDAGVAVESFADPQELGRLLAEHDVVAATTSMSVGVMDQALKTMKAADRPRTAYYVQDYEPLFFRLGTPEWEETFASYTRIAGMRPFAKTDWICSVVEQNHEVAVARVKASIDHAIYYPDLSRRTDGPVRIAAMLRPKTRRRAPRRTARILSWLVAEYGHRVIVECFGAPAEELASAGIDLPASVVNHGRLRRTQVPRVLRGSDLFLDLSDYQAFGRTGLEAMASGCTPVLPIFGGADEYAVHGRNSFVVDTRSDDAIREAIAAFIEMPPVPRRAMRMDGIVTAAGFSVERAVASELAFFESIRAN